MAEWARKEMSKHSPRMLLEAGQAIATFSSRHWVHGIDVPTTVLVTTRDSAVLPAGQFRLATRDPALPREPHRRRARGVHRIPTSAARSPTRASTCSTGSSNRHSGSGRRATIPRPRPAIDPRDPWTEQNPARHGSPASLERRHPPEQLAGVGRDPLGVELAIERASTLTTSRPASPEPAKRSSAMSLAASQTACRHRSAGAPPRST